MSPRIGLWIAFQLCISPSCASTSSAWTTTSSSQNNPMQAQAIPKSDSAQILGSAKDNLNDNAETLHEPPVSVFANTLSGKKHGHNPHIHYPHFHHPHLHIPHVHYLTKSPTQCPTPSPVTISPVSMTPTSTRGPTFSRSPTLSPTSGHPTSIHPTSSSPSTINPTSLIPTSLAPTITYSPTATMIHPTSLSPQTIVPTSQSPTRTPTASNPFNGLTPTPVTRSPSAICSPTCEPSRSPTVAPTSEPLTANPSLIPTTISPATPHPSSTHPLTQRPSTMRLTEGPSALPTVTTNISYSPTFSQLSIDCVKILGPEQVWVHAGAILTAILSCFDVTTTLWKSEPLNGYSVAESLNTLASNAENMNISEMLESPILRLSPEKLSRALSSGSSSGIIGIVVCAVTEDGRRRCLAQELKIIEQVAPTLELLRPFPIPCGSQTTIKTVIKHAYENITASIRSKFRYQWTLKRLPSSSGRLGGLVETGISGQDTVLLKIAKGVLEPGETYIASFSANMTSFYRSVFSISVNFTTPISDLTALIDGGTVREIEAKSALTLTAVSSTDPDLSPNSIRFFKWTCIEGTGCTGFRNSAISISKTDESIFIPPNTLTQGMSYHMQVNFTLVSNGGFLTRWGVAEAWVYVSELAIPSVQVKSLEGSKISLSSTVRILAVAAPSALSSSSQEQLTYLWDVQKNNISIPFPSTSDVSSISLVLKAATLGPGTFTFRVTAFDPLESTQATTVSVIEISQPPLISNMVVSPSTGFAYETQFGASCLVASSNVPVRVRFSFNSSGSLYPTVLRGYGDGTSYQVTLPAGTHTISIEVKDLLGGYNLAYYDWSVKVQTRNLTLVDGSDSNITDIVKLHAQRRCNATRDAMTTLRGLATATGALTQEEADVTPVVKLMQVAPDALVKDGNGARASRMLLYALEIIKGFHSKGNPVIFTSGIPPSDVDVAECSSLGLGNVVEFSGSYNGLSAALLKVLSDALASQVYSGAASTEQSVQVLVQLSNPSSTSTQSGSNIDSANQMVGMSENIVSSLDPATLSGVDGEIIQSQTIEILGNIMAQLNQTNNATASGASANSTVNATSNVCSAFWSTINLASQVARKSVLALAPGETPFHANTKAFQTAAQRILTASTQPLNQSSAFAAAVNLPTAANSTRGSASLVITVASLSSLALSCYGLSSTMTSTSTSTSTDSWAAATPITTVTIQDPSGTESSGSSNLNASLVFTLLDPTQPKPDAVVETKCVSYWTFWSEPSCTSIEVFEKQRVCGWWEVDSQTWRTSGCHTHTTAEGVVTCACDHLTEFAVLEQQGKSSKLPPSKGIRRAYVVGAWAFFFLAIPVAFQIIRILYIGKILEFVGEQHLLMLAQCISRVVSCMVFANSGTGYELSPWELVVVMATPYSLSFWSYTFLAFQWIALAHNTNLSKNPFQKWRPVYIGVNVLIVMFAWVMFGVYIVASVPSMVLTGSILFGCLCFAVASLILVYAVRVTFIVISMKNAGNDSSRSRFWKITISGVAMGFVFIVQSVIWIASALAPAKSLGGLTMAFLACETINICVFLFLYWRKVDSIVGAKSKASSRKSGHIRTTTSRRGDNLSLGSRRKISRSNSRVDRKTASSKTGGEAYNEMTLKTSNVLGFSNSPKRTCETPSSVIEPLGRMSKFQGGSSNLFGRSSNLTTRSSNSIVRSSNSIARSSNTISGLTNGHGESPAMISRGPSGMLNKTFSRILGAESKKVVRMLKSNQTMSDVELIVDVETNTAQSPVKETQQRCETYPLAVVLEPSAGLAQVSSSAHTNGLSTAPSRQTKKKSSRIPGKMASLKRRPRTKKN